MSIALGQSDTQFESHTEHVGLLRQSFQPLQAVGFHQSDVASVTNAVRPSELSLFALVLTYRDKAVLEVANMLEISLR